MLPSRPLRQPARDRRVLLGHGGRLALGALLGLGSGLMAGCGFRLRSNVDFPFSTMVLSGPPQSAPVLQEIRRQLNTRVRWVETPQQAQALLTIEASTRQKFVTSITSTGLVRGLVLRLTLRFRLSTPTGATILDSTELLLQRDLSTSEDAALAKSREEDEIFRVIERELVTQIIRRIEVGAAGFTPAAGPAPR